MQTQEVTIKPHVRVVMQSDTELLDEVVVVAVPRHIAPALFVADVMER